MNLHGFNEAIKHVITKTLEIFLFQKHPLVVLVIVILVLDVCIFFFCKKKIKIKKAIHFTLYKLQRFTTLALFFAEFQIAKKQKLIFRFQ